MRSKHSIWHCQSECRHAVQMYALSASNLPSVPGTEALCCSFACLSVCHSFSLSLSPSHSFSHSPTLPSVCDLDTGSEGDTTPLGEKNQSREGGRAREEVHTSLFYRTRLRPVLGAVLHLEVWAVEKWSQRIQQSQRSCPETLLQPRDTDRDIDREGGSVLHWANTQTWLLNLCPASALSASSQGLPIKLRLPGLENSNSWGWK